MILGIHNRSYMILLDFLIVIQTSYMISWKSNWNQATYLKSYNKLKVINSSDYRLQ